MSIVHAAECGRVRGALVDAFFSHIGMTCMHNARICTYVHIYVCGRQLANCHLQLFLFPFTGHKAATLLSLSIPSVLSVSSAPFSPGHYIICNLMAGLGDKEGPGTKGQTDGKELCLKVCNTIAARAIIIAHTQSNTIAQTRTQPFPSLPIEMHLLLAVAFCIMLCYN